MTVLEDTNAVVGVLSEEAAIDDMLKNGAAVINK